TADRSRAWLWQKTSDADQQLAHAAGSVERTADSASARAQERAEAARTEIADSGRESADKLRDRSWYARRDSAVDYDEPQLKNQNSVMQALDNKFDEARAALRSTREDLKAMAPQPSNEGLVGVGEAQIGRAGGINGTSASDAANRAANGQPVELKFVESNSGIPLAKLALGDERIIGGTQAPSGMFPFIVHLFKDGNAYCGGTLIDSEWVLTAAHCVTESDSGASGAGSFTPINPGSFKVGYGTNGGSLGDYVEVDSIVVSTGFDP
ncbi:Serine protease 56, partial [Coemansia sp. RSA 2702]